MAISSMIKPKEKWKEIKSDVTILERKEDDKNSALILAVYKEIEGVEFISILLL